MRVAHAQCSAVSFTQESAYNKIVKKKKKKERNSTQAALFLSIKKEKRLHIQMQIKFLRW